jgi:hypothetical protein
MSENIVARGRETVKPQLAIYRRFGGEGDGGKGKRLVGKADDAGVKQPPAPTSAVPDLPMRVLGTISETWNAWAHKGRTDCWIVAAGATEDWSGKEGAIAGWTAGGWQFVQPCDGLSVRDKSTASSGIGSKRPGAAER